MYRQLKYHFWDYNLIEDKVMSELHTTKGHVLHKIMKFGAKIQILSTLPPRALMNEKNLVLTNAFLTTLPSTFSISLDILK